MQIKNIKPENLTQGRNIYVGTLDEQGNMVMFTFKEFIEIFDDFRLLEASEAEPEASVRQKKRGRPKKTASISK